MRMYQINVTCIIYETCLIVLITEHTLCNILHKQTRAYNFIDTFNNCISYKELTALVGGLTFINPRYQHWKFMFRSTLYAQSQTTDLLPGNLHHALLGVQRWLIVIRCLLKFSLVFGTYNTVVCDR